MFQELLLHSNYTLIFHLYVEMDCRNVASPVVIASSENTGYFRNYKLSIRAGKCSLPLPEPLGHIQLPLFSKVTSLLIGMFSLGVLSRQTFFLLSKVIKQNCYRFSARYSRSIHDPAGQTKIFLKSSISPPTITRIKATALDSNRSISSML